MTNQTSVQGGDFSPAGLPPLPLEGGALYVDNSMLELLQTCNRALQYDRLHKRIAAADKPSLAFGSAIHLALEYRYRRYGSGPVDYDFEQEAYNLLQPFFAAKPPPVDDFRTLDWAMTILREYMQRYSVEPFQMLTSEQDVRDSRGAVIMKAGEPAVELPFALPLFTWRGPLGGQDVEIPVIYTGRIDLPVREDGDIYVMDHKTTSMMGQSFFERAAILAQQRGYVYSFQQLTGLPVRGYIVNGIRTKTPAAKLTGKTAKPYEITKYWDASFGRQRYLLSQDDLLEWKHNAISLVKEMMWCYQQGYMPMKTAWCMAFGKCQYYDVCTLPLRDRGTMLESGLYAPNTWSPLKSPSAPQV